MKIAAAVALALTPLAGVASAQNAGATVSGAVAAANLDSRTELTFAGAFGYRFNRTVGIELEATVVPTLKSPFATAPSGGQGFFIQSAPTTSQSATTTSPALLIYPGPVYTNPNGRVVIFSNNLRVEIPTERPALTPYFVAGGGIANLRRTADFTYPVPLPLAGASATPVPIPIRPTIVPVSSSATDLALTLGGGLSIRVSSHVSADADLRFFRLLGAQDRNVGRFGAGARYRF